MARILGQVLLFLLPFLAFALYLRYGRRVDSIFAGWSVRSLLVCSGLGIVLLAGSLYILESAQRGPTTGRYVPPTWQDGVLIPGHIE
ncbi:DUF6111 family protein [Ancylobacter radicis]|uniref:Uncharacterized protein n=1 Tax=Ancylobacter radicis TaxID=2836179 RepID=A0ABS5RA83_9HYPH|nr:DUF6111 family protein [Ancylobacter radicis]MBS9478566.1 hypothetical protein [Ancylobacter radicis]